MINAALNIAKYYKRRKGKQIETHYAENLPQLWAVRDQLIQVFLNLILNAFEATEEGTTFSITSALTDEQEIRVEFQDEGHGIAPENLDRVFRPYFTTKRTGTGLGLFVCRNVVSESAGGRLELTETSPTGTCFTIFLPVHTEGGSTEQDDSRSATEDISPTASITSTSP
jgi:signal transduction histidine kinase